jgi:DnaJ family protein B protein 6
VYDQYGKAGLSGNSGAPEFDFNMFHSGSHHPHAHHAFRDPFEVFREFFGGQDPFAGFFGERGSRKALDVSPCTMVLLFFSSAFGSAFGSAFDDRDFFSDPFAQHSANGAG